MIRIGDSKRTAYPEAAVAERPENADGEEALESAPERGGHAAHAGAAEAGRLEALDEEHEQRAELRHEAQCEQRREQEHEARAQLVVDAQRGARERRDAVEAHAPGPRVGQLAERREHAETHALRERERVVRARQRDVRNGDVEACKVERLGLLRLLLRFRWRQRQRTRLEALVAASRRF